MIINLYSIIVTYMPKIDTLISLIEEMERADSFTIIIDNSEADEFIDLENLQSRYTRLKIIKNHRNIGLAAAQNIGIKIALESKAHVLAFFDQDSSMRSNDIRSLFMLCHSLNRCVVGPLSIDCRNNQVYPVHNLSKSGFPKKVNLKTNEGLKKVDIIISSGMFASSVVFLETGLMNERYFIDFIDIDFCIRCKKHNVPIYVDTSVSLIHQIGENLKKIVFFEEIFHTPRRSYYKIRNTLILFSVPYIPKYFSLYQFLSAFLHAILIILTSNKKIEYTKMYTKGVVDGLIFLIKKGL